MTVSGTVNDPDGNNVTLRYKLNGGSFVEVYNGKPSAFSFTLPIASLVDGANTLTLQALDTFNFTAQKSFNIQRDFNGSELTEAVARYELLPANGEATGLVTWVERDSLGTVSASVSMTDAEAAEAFVAMNSTNTVELIGGLTEDEFDHIELASKAKTVLKLKTTKSIAKVSGAFQV